MLILTNTGTDKLQLVSSAAVALDVHVSYADLASGSVTPGRQNTAISTAATTDICATPGASTVRNVKTINVRNKGASNCDVTIVYDANGTDFELHKVTLKPAEVLEYVEGIGWFTVLTALVDRRNYSTAAQGAGFSSDTYLTGSYLKFPSGGPAVGSQYCLKFDVVKTAAGTAAPVLTVRVGTAGTTADTARHTLTWGAGTAAADTGVLEVCLSFRSVGASGVSQAQARFTTNLTTTGLSNAVKALQNTSAAYDTTVTDSGIGASWNGGASASHTVQLVRSEFIY